MEGRRKGERRRERGEKMMDRERKGWGGMRERGKDERDKERGMGREDEREGNR